MLREASGRRPPRSPHRCARRPRASRSRPSALPRPPLARSAAPPPTDGSGPRRRPRRRGSRTSTRTPPRRSWPARSPAAAAGCGPRRSRRCWPRTGSRSSSSGGSGRSPARRRPRPSWAGRSRSRASLPASCTRRRPGRCGSICSGPTAVRRAAQDIAHRLEGAGTPVEDFLVQRMARAGVEMLVGVLADERFGPVVACGAGGGTAEVLGTSRSGSPRSRSRTRTT